MGRYAGVSVKSGCLTEHDAALLTRVGPILTRAAEVSRAGRGQCDNPYMAVISHFAPDVPHLMMEHLVMAALLVASFIVPIFRLLG